MCAINGFSWSDEKLIRKMNERTQHRGPDDTGIYVDERVSLGNNRLAIIDLSSDGHQPMQSADGRLIIVYNGELYNYRDLRDELRRRYVFSTECDTEVILAAYQTWGKECVTRFNGIFAFAIWDTTAQELFLARDHVGAKPLYYHHDGSCRIFSSEIKAILEHAIPRRLDKEAMSIYFRILYVPEPLTMFSNIRKFPPASRAVFSRGKLAIEQYWDPQHIHHVERNPAQRIEELRTRVYTAVKRQLISDRPLGIYLSGGIDSSVVLCAASRVRSGIDTFSVGFDLEEGEEREKFNIDQTLAGKTAAWFHARHHEVMLSSHEVPELFTEAVKFLDEPLSNPTSLAQLKLARFTKPHATVALSGDGGDELFGGYERYRLSLIASRYQHIVPSPLRTLLSYHSKLRKLNISSGIDQFSLFMFLKDDVVETVLKEDATEGDHARTFFEKKFFERESADMPRYLMDVDRQSWLIDESLMRTDKMNMAAAVEARVPLLDRDIVEYALSLPTTDLVTVFGTKKILRDAFRRELPPRLFREPKRGFFSPAAKWLRRPEIAEFARGVLHRDFYPEAADLFDFNGIGTVLEDHIEKRRYNLTVLWALLTFQLWAKQFNITL